MKRPRSPSPTPESADWPQQYAGALADGRCPHGLRSLLRQPALRSFCEPYPTPFTTAALAGLTRATPWPPRARDKTAVLKELLRLRISRRVPRALGEEYVYFLFHKPAGCVASRADAEQQGGGAAAVGVAAAHLGSAEEGGCAVVAAASRPAPTVYDVLPKGFPHCPFSGRLDRMTEGLLLFTDDGRLLNALMRKTEPPLPLPPSPPRQNVGVATVATVEQPQRQPLPKVYRVRACGLLRWSDADIAWRDALPSVHKAGGEQGDLALLLPLVQGAADPHDEASDMAQPATATDAGASSAASTCPAAMEDAEPCTPHVDTHALAAAMAAARARARQRGLAPQYADSARQQLEALRFPLRCDDAARGKARDARKKLHQQTAAAAAVAGDESCANGAEVGAAPVRWTHPADVRLVWQSNGDDEEDTDFGAAAAAAAEVAHEETGTVGPLCCELVFQLWEGSNRQIRRLCNRSGLAVRSLQRVALGVLQLGDLPRGAARPLRSEELHRCYESTGLLLGDGGGSGKNKKGDRRVAAVPAMVPLPVTARDVTENTLQEALAAPACRVNFEKFSRAPQQNSL